MHPVTFVCCISNYRYTKGTESATAVAQAMGSTRRRKGLWTLAALSKGGVRESAILIIFETRVYDENLKIRKLTIWDALGRSGTLWGRSGDALGHSGTFWDAPGRSGTLWDALGGLGDVLGRSGTLWGALWTLWDTWECSGMMMIIVFHFYIYKLPINRLSGR